jgi:hypothetical protein
MAITLQFNICEYSGCSKLVFTDTTGAYNATNNPSGYGTPNDTISSATAELVVTLANGRQNTITLTGFPTTDKTKEFYITAQDLGYGVDEQIEDQRIHFIYKVTTDQSNVLTQDYQQGFYCLVECCVRAMSLDIDTSCDDCIKSSMDRILEAQVMLQGLKYTANSGHTATFDKTLAQLKKKCLNQNCQNCK